MGMEIIVVAILAAIACLIWGIRVSQQRDKWLDLYTPLERERNRLRDELSDARKRLSSGKSAADPDAAPKSKKKKKKAAASGDGGKNLKEENYTLKQEVKELRKQVRGRGGLNDEAQNAIAAARDEAEKARREMVEAQRQLELAIAQKEREEREEGKTIDRNKDDGTIDRTKDAEGDNKDEVARLRSQLASARADAGDARKAISADLDAARRDAAATRKKATKDLRTIKRQATTQQKRAENNHKALLITRAQLLAVEERLSLLDQDYVRTAAMPTTHRGIEEAIKKFNTRGARSAKLNEDLAAAQAEVQRLGALLASHGVESAEPKAAEPEVAEPEVAEPEAAPEPKPAKSAAKKADKAPEKKSKAKKTKAKGKKASKDAAPEPAPEESDAETAAEPAPKKGVRVRRKSSATSEPSVESESVDEPASDASKDEEVAEKAVAEKAVAEKAVAEKAKPKKAKPKKASRSRKKKSAPKDEVVVEDVPAKVDAAEEATPADGDVDAGWEVDDIEV